jgi:hypothetical protein
MGRKSLESRGDISQTELYDLYVTQSLSVKAIAAKKQMAQGTIFNYLKKYSIPRRPRGSRRSRAAAPEVTSFVHPEVPVMEKQDESTPT